MKCNLLIIALSFLCNINIVAQELNVKSFVVKTNDITARTQPRQDINGNDCAMIKVQLAASGAEFDGNVVGNVSYNKSEYLVYMSEGSKRLSVKLEGYLPLEASFEDYGIMLTRCQTLCEQEGRHSQDDCNKAINNLSALNKYVKYNDLYHNLRCGMLHAFAPDCIILTRGMNDIDKNKIGAKEFFSDLRKAWEELKMLPDCKKHMMETFILDVVGISSGSTLTQQ